MPNVQYPKKILGWGDSNRRIVFAKDKRSSTLTTSPRRQLIIMVIIAGCIRTNLVIHTTIFISLLVDMCPRRAGIQQTSGGIGAKGELFAKFCIGQIYEIG